MDTNRFINSFIASANAFDVASFLAHWHKDAVLDDPSVGRKFKGLTEMQEYFDDYFITYNTQTKLVNTEIKSDDEARIEVMFTGTFPQGKIGGTFDFVFKGDKILHAVADLLP